MSDIVINNLFGYGIVVLVFNLAWRIQLGWAGYKEMFNGEYKVWFSIFVWLYLLSGISSLLIALFNIL
jgi:hypothetical protein